MCAAVEASAETDRHIMRCEQKFEMETCHMPLFRVLARDTLACPGQRVSTNHLFHLPR